MKTFNAYDKVVVRSNSNMHWRASFYSHKVSYDKSAEHMHETTDGSWVDECLPFEGNEHLVGTRTIINYK